MYKINLVEDEVNLANILSKYLINENYEVNIFNDGAKALESIDLECHLWILDIMLPGSISGYDIVKEIKSKYPDKPIVFTSARDQEIDKILGLELGGDDYIAKPYSPREVVLRINKIVQRCYKINNEKVNPNLIQYNGYTIYLDKRSVCENNEIISLTSKEYDLLIFLFENKALPLSREEIITHIWGPNYFGSDRVVDDLMRRLRQKMIELDIETMYAFGYRLK
ncbi:MAG: response regulator transcription factor [Anaeroplasmataceae bacterium]